MENSLHKFSNAIFDGANPSEAKKAAIFVHGRGDASNGLQQLARQVVRSNDFALAFPKATNATWYPASFLQPWEVNQPWLDSALDNLNKIVKIFNDNGIADENIYFLGFSQGACLALDYTARNAKKLLALELTKLKIIQAIAVLSTPLVNRSTCQLSPKAAMNGV